MGTLMAGIKDDFPGTEKSLNAPAREWAVITPHDTNLLARVPKAIHLGGAVDAVEEAAIVCTDKAGIDATFYLRQGDILPIRPHKIKSTGTTPAAVIIALY